MHVLSTPPAFVLSQDQTLQKNQKQNKPATSHHHTHPNNQARTHATATHNQKNKNKPENKNSPPTTPQDPTQPPPQTTQQQPHKTPQRHRQTMAQKTSTLSRSQTTHPQDTPGRNIHRPFALKAPDKAKQIGLRRSSSRPCDPRHPTAEGLRRGSLRRARQPSPVAPPPGP